MQIILIVLGSIFIFYLPGLFLSHVLFAKKEIDGIERMALSFSLSVSVIPLLVFSLNFIFKIRINLLNICLVILSVIGLSIGIVWWRSRISQKYTI
jgi:uncharacterized membrane protein